MSCKKTNIHKLIDASKICSPHSHKYSGIEYPWTSDGFLYATDGRQLIWFEFREFEIPPIGKVPDLENFKNEVLSIKEWSKLVIDWPKCKECTNFIDEKMCSNPEETCESCTTEILGQKFSFENVNRINELFSVEGVAITDRKLAFKLSDGYSLLMPVVEKST